MCPCVVICQGDGRHIMVMGDALRGLHASRKGRIMGYEEFTRYVWEMILRNKAYQAEREAKGDPAAEVIRVRITDQWGERTSTIQMGVLYEAVGQFDKDVIRARVRQILPWSGRDNTPLTIDACRRILGAERQPMFESLRILRQAYARRENVAPYIIFSNHALLAMCQEGPETMEDFRELPGVGIVNSTQYGEGFLELIRYHNQKRAEQAISAE